MLVQAAGQYRWLKVAQRLLTVYRVHVSFGEKARTWAEGVVYGLVASEHKGENQLGKNYVQ